MLTHMDDVEESERRFGHIWALRQLLGAAAGAREIGLSRWRIEAEGRVCSPAHVHFDEEEIFYVLDGTGFAQAGRRAYAISAGDAVVFPAGGRPHTVFGGPIELLAFASGSSTRLTYLPRSKTMWAGPTWLPLDGGHPFDAEAELGPLELGEVVDPADERPSWIVGLTEVEAMPIAHGDRDEVRTDLGSAAGSRLSGLRHIAIAPDAEGAPPHCHTAEEELFVVLDGDGTLRLGDQEHPVRAGSIVARPAGTGVAHSFRAGGQGLTLLAYGQRDPRDAVFFPRSSTLRMAGLGGLTFRVEPVDPRGGAL
ncbi:cupin domain-containing protein [Capillimicrobium parvum]|uniref:Cupin type-2 domain-containing protein n=1 Tax=Capillimicrobium parvum TaxID=2884022 RepID=A0A9E7BZW8_9ACTN|nr:cupin domain-containing protein [Capillimicrobium parvum]UGS35009.1 hypothetical protein DSM104329_01393 [Capillimicrobium parvum]